MAAKKRNMVVCKGCECIFHSPNHTKYCSRKCYFGNHIFPKKNMAICAGCGTDFYSPQHTKFCTRACYVKYGVVRLSKEDRLEKRRNYRLANIEKFREDGRSERNKERARKLRQSNLDRFLAYGASWREKNREYLRESSKKYHKSEGYMRKREREREIYQSDSCVRMERLAKNAFQRAISADLPFDQCLKDILASDPPTHCKCCGNKFSYKISKGRLGKLDRDIPTLDRVVPRLGYTVENSRVICWGCNMKKSNLTLDDLEMLIKYVKANSLVKEEERVA